MVGGSNPLGGAFVMSRVIVDTISRVIVDTMSRAVGMPGESGHYHHHVSHHGFAAGLGHGPHPAPGDCYCGAVV